MSTNLKCRPKYKNIHNYNGPISNTKNESQKYMFTDEDDNDQDIVLILTSECWLLLARMTTMITCARFCITKIDVEYNISTNK